MTAVLESLSAPIDAEDTRTREQRYHDALQEAMRRLVAGGLLPERAGQPVKAMVHVSLAELRAMDDSELEDQWAAEMRARWAAHRAAASEGGSDGGAWLDGDAARGATCDAALTAVVTGEVDLDVIDDLVRMCVQLDRLEHGAANVTKNHNPDQDSPVPRSRAWLRRRGRRWFRPSSARPPTYYPDRVGWPRFCGPGGSGRAAGRRRACRWTSATPRPSRPGSATRSSCAIGDADGPVAAASPPRPARSTTSSTKPTGDTPVSKAVCFCVRITTRS